MQQGWNLSVCCPTFQIDYLIIIRRRNCTSFIFSVRLHRTRVGVPLALNIKLIFDKLAIKDNLKRVGVAKPSTYSLILHVLYY